ncbi:hypothetical protein EDB80DRAFT_682126 [Ilyonectria destructans]|nr:hypothetical protein EDB80DRAFT_682126 [Ilyonectria destructans]
MADSQATSSNQDRIRVTVSVSLVIVFALIIGGLAYIARPGSLLSIRQRERHPSANAVNTTVNTTGGLGRNTAHYIPLVVYHPRASHLEDAHTLKAENKRSEHEPSDGGIQTPRPVFIRHSKPTRKQPESGDGYQSECPICTEDFVDGVLLRLLLCGHLFHPECIDPWLERRARTCPLCRAKFRVQPPPAPSASAIR